MPAVQGVHASLEDRAHLVAEDGEPIGTAGMGFAVDGSADQARHGQRCRRRRRTPGEARVRLEAVGLPATYPRHLNGRPVRHADCQSVGRAVVDDGRPGVACRSAADGPTAPHEELAVFDRRTGTGVHGRQPFAEWFWGTPP